ncbi:MAG: ATPase, T2SS/T4P/T4SS family [Blastocatellia bacterium]
MLNFINRLFAKEEKNVINSTSNNTSNDNFMRRSSTNNTANLTSTNKSRITGSLARRETKEDLPTFVNDGLQQINGYNAKLESYSNGTNNSNKLVKSSYALSSNNNDNNLPIFDVNAELAELNKEKVLHVAADTNPFYIDGDTLALIPFTVADQYSIIPTGVNANRVTIYYSNEMLKSKGERVVTSLLGVYNLDWQLVDSELVNELIKHNYKNTTNLDENTTVAISERLNSLKSAFSTSKDTSVIFDYSSATSSATERDYEMHDIISALVKHAIDRNATDINISNNLELLQNGRNYSEIVVRMRIDGEFIEVFRRPAPSEINNGIARSVKVFAGRNSVDDRSDDSGTISAVVRHGRQTIPIELRCQFMPSSDRGIAISIRIQRKYDFNLTLDNIGLLKYQRKIIDNILDMKHGVVFFNGSINRGKSSTQVAFLQAYQKRHPNKHVVLVEDTREFILPNISQIQIPHGKAPKDIEKSLLRYDPDMIAFGETRDETMTDTIMRLAEVGSLMSCTIHATNAATVAHRLISLGIPRYKVADCVRISISQVLARKICPNCVRMEDTKYKGIPQFRNYLKNLGVDPDMQFYVASGRTSSGDICHICNGSGTKGRTGIFEILSVSKTLKSMILDEKISEKEFRQQALLEGFQSIWMNSLRKAILGEITITELLEVVEVPSPEDEGLNLNLEFNTDSYEIEDVLN